MSIEEELLKLKDRELRVFLWEMHDTLTLWLHTYAGELCDKEKVDESLQKIMDEGGTLAIIAKQQEKIRNFLDE